VVENPATIDAPQVALSAPGIVPVVPGPATNLILAPTIEQADTTALSPAGNNLPPGPTTMSSDPDDQDPSIMPAMPAMPAPDQQQSQG
jgi:hypothetical protein